MNKIPIDVCLNNGVLSWPPIPGADGYNLHKGPHYIVGFPVNDEENSRSLSFNLEELEEIGIGPIDLDGAWSVSAYWKFHEQPSGHSKRSLPAIDKPRFANEHGKEIFFDDFSSFNADVWERSHLWAPIRINNELQEYVADEEGDNQTLFFGPDGLGIRAKRKPDSDTEWLSGKICSHGNMTVGPNVFVEARIKTSAGGGLWPAFWLMNAEYGNGTENEIDIMENLGQEPGVMYQTFHHRMPTGVFNYNAASNSLNLDPDEFHVYAIARRQGYLVWYIDGFPVFSYQSPHISAEKMYVVLNLAVGGNWPGTPPASLEAGSMDVSYLRISSLESAE